MFFRNILGLCWRLIISISTDIDAWRARRGQKSLCYAKSMWLSKWYLIWLNYGLCSGGWDWKEPSFHGHMCPAVLLLAHVSVQTAFIWCGLLFCEWEYYVRTFSCFSCSARLAVYEVWHGPQRKDEIGRKWAWTPCGTCVPGLGSFPGREAFPRMGSVPVGVPGCCAGVHSLLPSAAGPQRKCKHLVLHCSGVAVADGSVRVGHLPWALHQWAGGLGRGVLPRASQLLVPRQPGEPHEHPRGLPGSSSVALGPFCLHWTHCREGSHDVRCWQTTYLKRNISQFESEPCLLQCQTRK